MQALSEFASIYIRIGLGLGFGLGIAAQFFPATKERWGLVAALYLTAFWPGILWFAVFGKK
jgi:hypothetical protein